MTSFFLNYMLSRKPKNREAIAIISRFPVSGECKTRLIPSLGKDGAARAQLLMTEHLLSQIDSARSEKPDLQVFVFYNGASTIKMHYWLDRKFPHLALVLKPQIGGNLGEVIANCFKECFDAGNERVIIVGSDIPGINESIIEDGLSLLKWDENDLVMGKAKDGGYYLIGMNRRRSSILEPLFYKGIDWGTEHVYDQQLEAAEFLELKVATLDQILSDVDVPDNLPVLQDTLGIATEELTNPQWSIIIPVLNESEHIEEALDRVLTNFSSSNSIEVIVVDGGSTDDTIAKVKHDMSNHPEAKFSLIETNAGRGHQLKVGAEGATGDILLFLHADTLLPNNYNKLAEECLWTPGNVAGAFAFAVYDTVDNPSTFNKFQVRMLELVTNARAKYAELPYGDQAIFIRRCYYDRIGGIREYRIFEDFAMIEEAKKIGHVGIVQEACYTSARRYIEKGYWRNVATNSSMVAAYKFGYHPDQLADWYYGKSSDKKRKNEETEDEQIPLNEQIPAVEVTESENVSPVLDNGVPDVEQVGEARVATESA